MNNTHIPWHARATAAIGRPAVLLGALVMGAPAEISLARTAGFSGGTEYLTPLVLSLYAVCAAIAATRPKGVRGRVSAIIGAIASLGLASGAQITAHLLAAGYVSSGPWLIAALSAAPSVSAAHLLHLAAVPRSTTVGVTHDETRHGNEEEPVNGSEDTKEEAEAAAPAAPRKKRPQGRSRPSLQAIRDAAQNLDAVGEKVTAKALAAVFQVSERTGARYLSALTA